MRSFWSAMIFLLLPVSAWAQTACPVGVAPGSPQCGPSPTYRGEPVQGPPRPTGRWQELWGAVAMDDVIGSVGASVDMDDEQSARADALRRCVKPGAKGCAVRIVYHNQCVALAWSDNSGHPGGLASGPELTDARKLATDGCRSHDGGSCQIVYSDCSLVKFVPF